MWVSVGMCVLVVAVVVLQRALEAHIALVHLQVVAAAETAGPVTVCKHGSSRKL